jgi:hypothetical protein
MSKAKSAAIEKFKKVVECKECGSKKHSTKNHEEIKGEKEDNEDDNKE